MTRWKCSCCLNCRPCFFDDGGSEGFSPVRCPHDAGVTEWEECD